MATMKSKHQGSFSSRLNRAFVLPFALLAVLAGILLFETESLRDSMQWVDHTDQVIGKSRNLLRHILDMEAGLRGFQLTGNDEFLQTYRAADTAVDSDFRDLNELIAHNPVQLERLEREQADFAQWEQFAVRTILRRRNGEDTSSYAENIEGERLMDKFREDREAFAAEARRLRDERVQRARRVSDFVLSSSVLLTLGIGGFVIFLTRRQMASLVTAYQETAEAAEQRAAELERLSAIVESSEDAIIGKTLAGTITSWNRGAERLHGYSAAEVLGRSMDILMPPEQVNHLTEVIQRVGRGERIEPHECVRRRKDGTLVDVSVAISPIRDRAGAIIGASSIVRDISERKRAEVALRQSEQRLSLALRAGHSGTFDWYIDSTMHDWSDEMLALYGTKREECRCYDDWLACLVPENRDAAAAALKCSLETGEFAMEFRIRRRDNGEVRWMDARGQVLYDEAGKPASMIGTHVDITEKKRAAEALRASEERLRLLGDNLPDSMVYQFAQEPDGSHHFLYVSAGIERLNGVKAEDVLKDADVLESQLLLEELPAYLEAVRISARDLSVFEREIRMRLPDGQLRWMHLRSRPSRLPNGRVIWDGVQTDITERKQVEAERDRLRVALLTAQEDAARQIARELHDDVAQRLALLSMEIGKTAARRSEAEELITELRSHQAKVLDISKSIRQISHQMHPAILDDLGLSAALESMCLDLQRVEGTRVHFEARDIPDDLDPALESCLFRVCQESLRNVSKHAKADNVTVVLACAGELLQLEILDFGVGFDFTEQRPGLGTYSIQERLRMVNGAVSIQSELGHGTRVIARVPLKGGALETSAHSAGN